MSNKIFIWMIALIMVAGMANAIYCGGAGSTDLPYQICTCNDLQDIRFNLNSRFMLMNDIDCSATSTPGSSLWNNGAGFEPIGTFGGTFDGKNFKITGLTINRSTITDVGLFSRISGSAASINNTGLIDSNIRGDYSVGALVGYANTNSRISNCYSAGIVSGRADRVGGLVGFIASGASIAYSSSAGSVSGHERIGGLVGNAVTSSISNSYSEAAVSSQGTYYWTGGLVGIIGTSSTISTSYATGSVSGYNGVGGLVGGADASSISTSYATGSVSGYWAVGGLVGVANNLQTISNSYATGSVSVGAGSYAGGLVGVNNGGTMQISNSYSAGSVSGPGSKGLLGYIIAGSTCTDSFWDNQTSGQLTSACGFPRTTAQMRTKSNFTIPMAGWDFDHIWAITSKYRNGYPYLIRSLSTYCEPTGQPETVCNGIDDNCDGCIDGDMNLTGQCIPLDCQKKNLLYLDGQFQSCGLDDTQNDILNKKLISSGTPYNKQLNNSAKICDVKGDWFCDTSNQKWDSVSKYDLAGDGINVIKQDKAVHNDTQGNQGCCPENMCWCKQSGAGGASCDNECVPNQKGAFSSMTIYNFTDAYRCVDGYWRQSYLKYDWFHYDSTYCDAQDQCFISPVANEGKPARCISQGSWFEDLKQRYCYDGQWSTRTKLIALQMLNFTESVSPSKSDYVLVCDEASKVLNNYNEYFIGSESLIPGFLQQQGQQGAVQNITQLDPSTVNNFCVLNYKEENGGKRNVLVGTSLNKDMHDANSSFLTFVLGKPITYCDNTMIGRAYLDVYSDDHIAVNSKSSFDSDILGISVWFNATDSTDGDQYIFKKDGQFYLKINDQGRLVAGLYDMNSTEKMVTSTSQIDPSKWYHVVITNNNYNAFNLYINGALDNSSNEKIQIKNTQNSIRIGSGFRGSIDEFKIYNRTLSITEASYEYNSFTSGSRPIVAKQGLIEYLPFDNDYNDHSGNGMDGTLTGNSVRIITLPNEFIACSPTATGTSDVFFNPAVNSIIYTRKSGITLAPTALDKLNANVQTFLYDPFDVIADYMRNLISQQSNAIVNYDMTKNIADFDRLYLFKKSTNTINPTCGDGQTRCVNAVIEEKYDGYQKVFMLIRFIGLGYEADVCNAIKKKMQGTGIDVFCDEVLE